MVTKAAVQYQGVTTSGGPVKLQPGKGKGGAGPAPVKVSVQDVIAQTSRQVRNHGRGGALYQAGDGREDRRPGHPHDRASAPRQRHLPRRPVSRTDQRRHPGSTYDARGRYDELADPKYTDTGGIFDIMAVTVIQTHLSFWRPEAMSKSIHDIPRKPTDPARSSCAKARRAERPGITGGADRQRHARHGRDDPGRQTGAAH
jgi:hypothetical protein